jgi:hypothetical protein
MLMISNLLSGLASSARSIFLKNSVG